MELVILFNKPSRAIRITIGTFRLTAGLLLILMLCAGSFYAGGYYSIGGASNVLSAQYQMENRRQLEETARLRLMINEAKAEAQYNLDALAARLSQMQGHIMRLDALGARLASMANLDDIEFDIAQPLGMGGPEPSPAQTSLEISDFLHQLDQLGNTLDDRSDKLAAIEVMLMDKSVQSKTLPAGVPVKQGWISSLFGWRADPLTGKREFHGGIDFAGSQNTEVIAVASGVVTWSGKRAGYGNLVEISHGNGYLTRYAHNRKNLVAVGDKVEKGQAVAIIGSTGRTTGTHVHFEVVRNGEYVDPKKYISVN